VIRLLIVDDSALMRKLLRNIFENEVGYEVAVAHDGVDALAVLGEFQPDVITLDIHMPRMSGLECLDRIMVLRPCPVIMVSALTEEGAEETLTALEMGAVDFVAKPGGPISLNIDMLTPRLIEKVRMAAATKIRRSQRLRDRVKASSIAETAEPVSGAEKQEGDGLPGLVLVGASTGGPSALDALLADLPANFSRPILIAQHMPASFTGPLARRLDKLCALTVTEVTHPTPLRGGHVYVGKGDTDIIVSKRGGRLVAMPAPVDEAYRWHPSVDRLVATAMKHMAADKLTGVLMTGMGSDGADEMAALFRAGGTTIAEAEETAVVWGMPGELVRQGGAGIVAPLNKLGAALIKAVS
jgi:two-component system chemotaxis response regulator CheB